MPQQHCDVLIVGAGPAGLSLAIALCQAGFTSTVLDRQPATALADPAPDGREIALTHASGDTLRRLGTWALLAPHEIGRIAEARVHDGPVGRHAPLRLHPGLAAGGQAVAHLGWIVPNHALRRTAHAVASQRPGVRILAGAQVAQVSVAADHAAVETMPAAGDAGDPAAPRTRLQARLVVAADSRFSAVRRQLGIGARMADFGRTVIVCRMRHAAPHHGIAHEAFGHHRTLAVLPLPDDPADGAPQCSVVVTTGAAEAVALMAQDAATFAAQVQAQFAGRLGAMALVGQRHAYPLVATYADRFAGHRCALLGDAAVGMHPVTAHGYNLGLAGVEGLARALADARQRGRDIGSADALRPYARAHHRRAWPIYEGTNAIVRLYTDARPLPRAVRQLVLQGARRLAPLKAAIVGELTGRSPWRPAPLGAPGDAPPR